jgi:hypothetical protein
MSGINAISALNTFPIKDVIFDQDRGPRLPWKQEFDLPFVAGLAIIREVAKELEIPEPQVQKAFDLFIRSTNYDVHNPEYLRNLSLRDAVTAASSHTSKPNSLSIPFSAIEIYLEESNNSIKINSKVGIDDIRNPELKLTFLDYARELGQDFSPINQIGQPR